MPTGKHHRLKIYEFDPREFDTRPPRPKTLAEFKSAFDRIALGEDVAAEENEASEGGPHTARSERETD